MAPPNLFRPPAKVIPFARTDVGRISLANSQQIGPAPTEKAITYAYMHKTMAAWDVRSAGAGIASGIPMRVITPLQIIWCATSSFRSKWLRLVTVVASTCSVPSRIQRLLLIGCLEWVQAEVVVHFIQMRGALSGTWVTTCFQTLLSAAMIASFFTSGPHRFTTLQHTIPLLTLRLKMSKARTRRSSTRRSCRRVPRSTSGLLRHN